MPSKNPRFKTKGPGNIINQFTRPIKRLEGYQNLLQSRFGGNFRSPTSHPLLEERIKQTKITKIKNS
jgi:hypothetical protein